MPRDVLPEPVAPAPVVPDGVVGGSEPAVPVAGASEGEPAKPSEEAFCSLDDIAAAAVRDLTARLEP